MQTLKDIHSSIVDMLSNIKVPVYPQEVKDGFKKPSFFVNVFPAKIKRVSKFMEDVIADIQIEYVSKTEKYEELIDMAEQLKNIFLYNTVNVGNRKFTIGEIEFETVIPSLFLTMPIEFTQNTGYDINSGYTGKMKNLNIGGL